MTWEDCWPIREVDIEEKEPVENTPDVWAHVSLAKKVVVIYSNNYIPYAYLAIIHNQTQKKYVSIGSLLKSHLCLVQKLPQIRLM